jgi:hypothetical protein
MTVLEAGSGEEALALIEEIGILPDIFLVDQQLGAGIRAGSSSSPASGPGMAGPRPADHREPGLGPAGGGDRAPGIEILYKPIEPQALQAVWPGSSWPTPGGPTLRLRQHSAGPGRPLGCGPRGGSFHAADR